MTAVLDRVPIAVDPALWAAFAEDRESPRGGHSAEDLTCGTCSRDLRPRGTTRMDYPGTVIAVVKGSCVSCYKGGNVSMRQHVPLGTPCRIESCAIPMRPAGRKSAEHPGTRRHSGFGLCSTCYERATREGSLDHYRKG